MVRFIVQRLGLAVVVIVVLSFASFCFFASTNRPYRDHPVLPAYWVWVKGVWTGSSLHPFPPGLLLGAIGRTSALLLLGLIFVVILSVAFAALAAMRPRSGLDVVLRVLSYLAWGVPAFLLALLLQEGLQAAGSAHGLGPFPIAGWPGSCPAGIGIGAGTINPCPVAGSGLTYLLNALRYLTLPALTLAVAFVGLHGRYLRAALIEAMQAPHIVTARAKGLSDSRVLFRHALPSSLGTFAAALLSDFGAVLGTVLAVDFLFQLRGIGWLFISLFPQNSFAPLDVYAIQLIILAIGLLLIAGSLLGEVAVLAVDPRQRAKL